MTSPAEGLGLILEDLGVLGGTTGWTKSIGLLQDIARSVALLDSGGRGGEVKVAIDYPSVQVLVLGDAAPGGYSAAYSKAKEVFDSLVGIDTPNGIWSNLVSCVALGFINSLGLDEKQRPRMSVNFRLITTPENYGNRTY